jgi:uncharacterized protein with PIN domain
MSILIESRCTKCNAGEMKLIENDIPGMNGESEEKQYDLWCCSSCYSKFIVEKRI